MKRYLFAVVLLGATACAFAGSSLKSEIEAMNKPIAAAMKKKDISAFTKIVKSGVTPDFKYSDEGGKPMDFNTMVAQMKAGLAMYSKINKVSSVIVSVKEKGDTGTAVEKHSLEGTTIGQDKKSHKMAFTGTSTETYKKVKGKWFMSSMSMKTDKMTMDGKAMPMGTRG